MNKDQIRASKDKAYSVLSNFQASYRKVNLVMDAIRGIDPAEAFFRLEAMRNKSAIPVHKLLKCALNNADQKSINEQLVIEHAFASKTKTLKRLEIKGRGRTGIRTKPYCDVTIILSNKNQTIENKKSNLKGENDGSKS